MSDAAAPAAGKPAEKKSTSKPSKPAEHPKFAEMIVTAIRTLKDRSGSSLPAITKFLDNKSEWKLTGTWKKTLSRELKKMVQASKLVPGKTTSKYKLSDALKKPPAKKKAVKAKKASPAKKPKAKKPAAKTEKAAGTAEKKPKKKTPAKARKPTTAKKTPSKKPAAKKPATKKAVGPKTPKAKKTTATKKPAAKKPTAKKPAAKKVAAAST